MSPARRSIYSIVSQGLVSATNFVMSIALLYFASQHDYVTFLLFTNVFALLSSLQNAIFISPIGVLVPRMADGTIRQAEAVSLRYAFLLTLLGLPFSISFVTQPTDWYQIGMMCLLVFIALALLLRRDILRNACLVRSDLGELLKYDLICFLMAFTAIGVSVYLHRLSYESALMAFALPALMMYFSRPRYRTGRSVQPETEIVSLGRDFWKQVLATARWAIPGVLVTWLFSNGYWFLLKHFAGNAGVAEMGAARLLFTPVGLMIQGWAMMFRPIAVNMAHAGKLLELRTSVLRQAMFGCFAITGLTILAYGMLLYFPHYLPKSMQAMELPNYTLIWGLYFVIQWFRSGMTIATLTDASGFRFVFKVGLIGCLVFYSILFFGISSAPIYTCLWGLVVTELIATLLLLRRFNDRGIEK